MLTLTLVKQTDKHMFALSLGLPAIFWNERELVIDLSTMFNIIFKPITTLNIHILGFKFIFSFVGLNAGDTSKDTEGTSGTSS